MPRISLLGCGLMGAPMARRLATAGFPLTLWNRTRAKAEALADTGAHIADTPAQAAARADIVITMLEHGGVVGEVRFGGDTLAPQDAASAGLRPGALLIDMSSILPEQARAHAQRLQPTGCTALDAPVSGGTLGAEAGTLAIMAGGDAGDVERARPVLEAMGRPVHVG